MRSTNNYYLSKLFIAVVLLIFLFSSAIAQEVKERKVNETAKIEKPNAPQVVEGDVIFSDGTNQLLRITDEGDFGAIEIKSGIPSATDDKLYNDAGTLKFNGSSLGTGGGVTKLDDLTDAKVYVTNLYLGNNAGANSGSGFDNVGIGYSALSNITTGLGNVAIGYEANYYNQTGDENTMIGAETGGNSTGLSGRIYIGYRAGFYETTDNKLYIENSDSDTPLIYGDFTDGIEQVRINGKFSVGDNSSAFGARSLAGGNNSQAHGEASIAFGKDNYAWGDHSSAFGLGAKAHTYLTTVIGRYNVESSLLNQTSWVSNDPLFEIGNGSDDANRSNALTVQKNGNTIINGNLKINGKAVLGSNANASGTNSFAIGTNVNVTANGTIFIGDNSASAVQTASTDNRFTARFANGYKFYTNSDFSLDFGAILAADQSSWANISDSTRKENFLPIDGEEILGKISNFNLRSWNYKGQDPSKLRHYGPMAQEFFNAFGNDAIGTIGNDTTITSADFDGINLIAIQALEKRSKEQVSSIQNLEARIKELEDQNQELAKINAECRTQNAELRNFNLELSKNIEQIKEAIHIINTQNKNVNIVLSE